MRVPVRLAKALLATAIVAFSACSAEPQPGGPVTDPARITVAASVDNEAVSVAVGEPRAGGDGTIEHTIAVTWRGNGVVTLDDARFTHHVAGAPGGDLVLAGRGCGAQWDERRQEVVHPCTMDLQIIQLAPGETHAYPARVHPRVGPLRLTPGSYAVQEEIGWQGDGEEGTFTVTLAYTVE